ncbi:hypothetical protein [Fibrobacter sp. UWP2]|uniref:glucuronyl esterase domain-containing protein n=1 Tax=Fibrobacter sp. UWP2 TaxID=1896216 RepID=UPI00091E8E67|nr:hypothetical protein [Fibrobacter sp. UWP2]SHI29022.1 hypothetical protein SAMN05720471_10114 [Fibrobacter sp. UWP2]
MNKRKFLFPVVLVAIGIWACGDDNAAAADECATPECTAVTPDPGSSSDVLGPASSAVTDPNDPFAQVSSAGMDLPLSSDAAQDPLSSVAVVPPLSVTDAGPGSSATAPGSSISFPPVSSSSEHGYSYTNRSSSSAVLPPMSSSVPTESSSSTIVTPIPSNDFVEDHRSECQIGNIPSSVNNAKLPDPFMGLDGKRISTKAEWKCRREEIGAMYEKLMFGTKPRNPEKVEGSYSGGKLTIKVTDKGKSGSFSVKISNAGTKDNPKPAMIGFGGGMMGGCGSLGNATNGLDIAQITFNPDDVAPESGGGMFFQLYNQGQGTIIAWAWGVSRIIDALEKTPEAGIDVHHLAMTGCSRWGKGTLAVGAFDERIALTIPQESGSGGASLWRVGAQVNKQKGKQFVQGLASAGTEGKWMISSFKNYDGKENTLPFDQHMLVSMVAPRALLIIDNAGQEWLGEVPSNYCGQASLETYKALGVTENYTYSQEGGHGHCQLPNGQFDEVKDFMNKFLLGKDANTGKIDYSKNTQTINFSKSEWIDWDTPTLK